MGCCQLLVKVCARSTGLLLSKVCQEKSVVRPTDRPDMTIGFLAVDLEVKNQTKSKNKVALDCKHILSDIRGPFFRNQRAK